MRKTLKSMKLATLTSVMLVGIAITNNANAALALDRTRVILNGDEQSVSLGITNQNKNLPFLAQAWVEDEHGKKISDPLLALPPVQRVEPGEKTQVKVQEAAGARLLPQDRESLFYFNLREIPPKSTKPNTLQIALQSRIKLFYRPAALVIDQNSKPWQEQITLSHEGDKYVVNNPTPYYVTISDGSKAIKGPSVAGFKPVMIAPKDSAVINVSAKSLGNNPVLTYINDFGGRPKLIFGCSGTICTVKATQVG